jgi:hypothetical protein
MALNAALLLLTQVVGAVILFAGLIKSIAPYGFERHLHALAWIPPKLVPGAVVAAAGAECAWGVALLLKTEPRFLFPLSIFSLLLLSFVSWSGVRSGKTTDCGCYGGYLSLSIVQSLALNGVFAVILLAAWLTLENVGSSGIGAPTAAVAAGLLASALTIAGQRHERDKGVPLIDISPIKPGKKWNHSWAGGATASLKHEFFVSFLGTSCPCCKLWVRLANVMTQSNDLPPVIGVVSATPERVATFVADHLIKFPVTPISQSLMARLARQVPTTAIIRDGYIQQVFVGMMPPEQVPRFKAAFFPEGADAIDDQAALQRV